MRDLGPISLVRAFVALIVVCSVGCGVSYSRNVMASKVPRADGTSIDVECIEWVRTKVSSISATPNPQPQVTIVSDSRVFVVRENQVLLNDQPYVVVPPGVKHLRIEIKDVGIRVTADGGTLLTPTPNKPEQPDEGTAP